VLIFAIIDRKEICSCGHITDIQDFYRLQHLLLLTGIHLCGNLKVQFTNSIKWISKKSEFPSAVIIIILSGRDCLAKMIPL